MGGRLGGGGGEFIRYGSDVDLSVDHQHFHLTSISVTCMIIGFDRATWPFFTTTYGMELYLSVMIFFFFLFFFYRQL